MNYDERREMAERIYAMPVGADLPNQKFKRGQLIKVSDKMPAMMEHFECGFFGIVNYSYDQKFGKEFGSNIDSGDSRRVNETDI